MHEHKNHGAAALAALGVVLAQARPLILED